MTWLRRFRVRFESRGVRVLLICISITGLVANWVPPVGDWLADRAFVASALLSLVAFALYDSIQRLADSLTAVDRAAEARFSSERLTDAVRVAFTDTVDRCSPDRLSLALREAFAAERVTIDVLAYTGETFLAGIYQGLDRLRQSPGRARKTVTVRLLVPDLSVPMQVPAEVSPTSGSTALAAFRKRLGSQCRRNDRQLRDVCQAIPERRGLSVNYECRVYTGMPMDKLCVINNSLVVHGFYDLTTQMLYQGVAFYDPKGHSTDMFVVREPHAAAWVGRFEGMWTVARAADWGWIEGNA